jgi:hypothetical protein
MNKFEVLGGIPWLVFENNIVHPRAYLKAA